MYSSYGVLRHCTVSYNKALSSSGGGIYINYVYSSTTPVVSNCLIANNSSRSYGSGIYANSNMAIVNSTIVNNAAMMCLSKLGFHVFFF